jgi:LysR family transcriptional regulator, regulator for bpeEF and oprC
VHDIHAKKTLIDVLGRQMQPSIRAINVFVTVVETKSFAAAARTLLTDPSVVSRAIKSLEQELGVILFARSTRELRLTEGGARFHRDCVQILQKLTEATQRFQNDRATPQGRINVGMAPGLPRRLLLRAIPGFQQQYPQIELVLLGVDEVAQFRDRSIDVLVRPGAVRQQGGLRQLGPQGFVVRKLAQSRFVLCASPEYLDRNGVPRAPTDLVHHSCVAFVTLDRDIQNEWQFGRADVRQKVKFSPKLIVQGTEAVREAGIAGCGIIRLGIPAVEDEILSRKLVPILTDWDCTGAPPYAAIYRKTRPMSQHVNVFVRHLAQEFQRYSLSSKAGARGNTAKTR